MKHELGLHCGGQAVSARGMGGWGRPEKTLAGEVRRRYAVDPPFVCHLTAGESAVDDAVLVASELVANALRHTVAGPDCMTVEVYRDVAVLWVHDADTDTHSVKPREHTSDAELLESGRGLQLIDELTAKWFVQPTAIGKAVVAVIELDHREAM